jgi:dihydropteroate synthase
VVATVNIRVSQPKNLAEAIKEIHKIETDANIIELFAPKAIQLCVFIEDIPCFAANTIKQEMLNNHGDAVVHKKSCSSSTEKTNALIVGNLSQINTMLMNLKLQTGTLADVSLEIQAGLQAVEKKEKVYFCCGKYKFEIGKKTYIMGILNVTDDSFSGDGILSGATNPSLKKPFDGTSIEASGTSCVKDKDAIIEFACRKAEVMVENGADIIDVGGESTRPGYTSVDAKEELDRVIGVVERLVKTLDVPISVDTTKGYVAESVLKAGAHIVNDVNGLIKDPKIAELAASYGAGVIATHNEPVYGGDVMSCLVASLRRSVDVAIKAGLKHENIMLDPGIGFVKDLDQNLEIMRKLEELKCLGYPVMLGTSRKSMIGKVLDLPVNERVEGTAATVTLGIVKGVDFIRVHDIKEMYRVVKMSDAMIRGI